MKELEQLDCRYGEYEIPKEVSARKLLLRTFVLLIPTHAVCYGLDIFLLPLWGFDLKQMSEGANLLNFCGMMLFDLIGAFAVAFGIYAWLGNITEEKRENKFLKFLYWLFD